MALSRTNQEWRQDLESTGDAQNAAIEELRDFLFRASLYTFQRNKADLANYSQEQINQLAEDCAQNALIAVLEHLPEFRGESKFTTWVYKFAVNISLTMARRERWKGVSLDDLMDEELEFRWQGGKGQNTNLDNMAVRREISDLIADTIRNDLTEKQRTVFKLIVFDEVPMDVIVERLNTNRNAVYKLLHDARQKLKLKLQSHGISIEDVVHLFQSEW
ncbi:MAG: sigma-70 family RNA polymerase sigma factor [Chloroflexi bacterium]|nr:MAG: sigma-70 family RNA polymerase sigma factor [Chloroflexota bacterium]